MEFYKKFTSNTLAGSGNQYYFNSEDCNAVNRGRVCYKVFCEGEFNYSFLFSNIIDSTFNDGSISKCNMQLPCWEIVSASISVIKNCSYNSMDEPTITFPLTFNDAVSKKVEVGEVFCSDSILIKANEGEYICVEIAFRGQKIPNHEETIIPSFVFDDGEWKPSAKIPFPSMVGCDRVVKKRIGFLGDSITQGIGTPVNSYEHYPAIVSEILGREYAYWDLGLGCARADDMASEGVWFSKAKNNDVVSVCFGVNDIWQGYTAFQIKQNLEKIIAGLKENGAKVIIQTIPPFNFYDHYLEIWNEVNDYIRKALSKKADLFFDNTVLLQKSQAEPHIAKYGDHPNSEGCKIWGEALAKKIKEFLQKTE